MPPEPALLLRCLGHERTVRLCLLRAEGLAAHRPTLASSERATADFSCRRAASQLPAADVHLASSEAKPFSQHPSLKAAGQAGTGGKKPRTGARRGRGGDIRHPGCVTHLVCLWAHLCIQVFLSPFFGEHIKRRCDVPAWSSGAHRHRALLSELRPPRNSSCTRQPRSAAPHCELSGVISPCTFVV